MASEWKGSIKEDTLVSNSHIRVRYMVGFEQKIDRILWGVTKDEAITEIKKIYPNLLI